MAAKLEHEICLRAEATVSTHVLFNVQPSFVTPLLLQTVVGERNPICLSPSPQYCALLPAALREVNHVQCGHGKS